MGGDCGERDTQDTLVLLGYAKRFASQRAYCDEASSMREAKGFYKKIKNKNKITKINNNNNNNFKKIEKRRALSLERGGALTGVCRFGTY